MSGSEGLASFANRFFHLSRPPDFKMAIDVGEKTKDLAALSAREVKRVAAGERRRDEYSSAEGLCGSK